MIGVVRFQKCNSDYFVPIWCGPSGVYVDDILLTGSNLCGIEKTEYLK